MRPLGANIYHVSQITHNYRNNRVKFFSVREFDPKLLPPLQSKYYLFDDSTIIAMMTILLKENTPIYRQTRIFQQGETKSITQETCD